MPSQAENPPGYIFVPVKGKRPATLEPLVSRPEFYKSDAVKLSGAIDQLTDKGPFSGIIMGGSLIGDVGGQVGKDRVRQAMIELALDTMKSESSSRRLLKEPFGFEFQKISEQMSVWVLSPIASYGKEHEVATFPTKEDADNLEEIRLLIMLTDVNGNNLVQSQGVTETAWDEISREVQRLDDLLDHWLDVPQQNRTECERCIGVGEGYGTEERSNISNEVSVLRKACGSKGQAQVSAGELGLSLDRIYERGRELESLQGRLDYRLGLMREQIKLRGREAETDWNDAMARPFVAFRERLGEASQALDRLAWQATNHASFRTMHEAQGTKKFAGLVGAIVFLLGVAGLYIESLQADQGATESGTGITAAEFAASFTVFSVVALAGYGAFLIGLFQLVPPIKLRKAASLIGGLVGVAVAVGVGGLVFSYNLFGISTEPGWAVFTVVGLALAGAIASLLWDPVEQEFFPGTSDVGNKASDFWQRVR